MQQYFQNPFEISNTIYYGKKTGRIIKIQYFIMFKLDYKFKI